MSPRLLLPEDLHRLMLGASVLGTGGGGSFSLARAMVEDLDARGMKPKLLGVDALEPGSLGVSTAILGGGLTHEDLEGMGMISDEPASVKGAEALSQYLGRPIDFVFPLEIGPQNTMEAVRLAAFLGVPVVDGDCAGRSVPELNQTTLSLFQVPLTPYVIVTFPGDLVIIPQVGNPTRNETLCRAIAASSGGVLSLTGFPAEGTLMQKVLIPGTLSMAMEIGKHLGPGRFPGESLSAGFNGRLAFRGRVRRFEMDPSGAFFRGWVTLDGIGAFSGNSYLIGFQNEYLWSWKNGAKDIQCPDLICVLDSESGVGKVTYGHGFENAIEVGDDLTVLHLPCAEVWRSEHGCAQFPMPPSIDLIQP